jgi:hypothetical protein
MLRVKFKKSQSIVLKNFFIGRQIQRMMFSIFFSVHIRTQHLGITSLIAEAVLL